MQLPFDISGVDPSELPPTLTGVFKVVIVREEEGNMDNKEGSGPTLIFFMKIIEGPEAGRELRDSMNIGNSNQQWQKLAYQRLSGYFHVTGKVGQANTQALYNVPFLVEVAPDKTNLYTNVKKLKDVNGNPPGQQSAPKPAYAQPMAPMPSMPQASPNGWPIDPPVPAWPAQQPQMQPMPPAFTPPVSSVAAQPFNPQPPSKPAWAK